MMWNEWVALIWLLGALVWGGPVTLKSIEAENTGFAVLSMIMCAVYTGVAVFYLVGV